MSAKDQNKDQTYFLHQLSQEQLKNTLFPLGGYTKKQVRKLARKFDLPTQNKEESMGICFVGEVPMEKFLKSKIKGNPGDIVFSNGKKAGRHIGLGFYTVGQKVSILSSQFLKSRKNEPLFVVRKDLENNRLIIGFNNDHSLYKKEIEIKNFHWINKIHFKGKLKCKFRLRHRQELQTGFLRYGNKNSEFKIISKRKQRAVSPGQFAVIYKKRFFYGYECLGGGEIF